MYAIIETGGKQIRVSEGSVIYVEKLDVEAGSAYTFDKVLMLGGESVNIVQIKYVCDYLYLLRKKR